MANWNKIKEKWNVEDRRAYRTTGVVWWIWIWTIAIALVIWYFNWADSALNYLWENIQQSQTNQEQQVDSSEFAWEDSYELFVSKIMGSNDKLWKNSFINSDLNYQKPKLVLFRWATRSVCWWATSQAWPHYCPADKTIYLDETFFEEMKEKFWAKGWDVAEAYVISHEYGHHVQNLLWITKKVKTNTDSIKLELQADCLAWIWASTLKWKNILWIWEINEAIDAAGSVWDDRIQKKMTWQIHPESWTHGSSSQRKKAFKIGYTYWDFDKCNTFK
jgi:predicted metalloprotease